MNLDTVALRIPIGVIVALSLASCGSNLDPGQVTRAAAAAPAYAVQQPGAVVPGVPGVEGSGAPSGSEGVPSAVPDMSGKTGGAGSPSDSGASGSSTSSGGSAPTTPEVKGPTRGDTGRPDKAAEAADCEGLENGTGITDSTITIGNASDISGPVPGLFESAQIAVKAFVDYYNASGSTICGRRLEMRPYDTRTDASADQQAYAAGCVEVFAMVGSMSGFDSGGAATAEKCGIPDLRAISTTSTRATCATCFAVQVAGSQEYQNAVPDYIKRVTGGQRAAMLYLKAGAAAESGPSQAAFGARRGVNYVYEAGIDAGEFNYVPFVQAMKEKDVESVQFIGANPHFVRMAQTMQQQGFKPKLFLLDPTAYSREYTEPAGEAAVGTVSYLNFTPFEEAGSNAEMNLYLRYIQQVKPGTEPDFFGVFAWSAARLFVDKAAELGGDLTRASLVASLRSLKGWTANGMHAPMRVGEKRPPECWRFVQWSGSQWRSADGTGYHCDGTTTAASGRS